MNTIVRLDRIFDNVQVCSGRKEEALRIISYLCARSDVGDAFRLAAAFRRREALYSTGFGGGIAIPHARIPGLREPVFALVRFARPVEWDAIDGKPVDLAVVAVTPGETERDVHLPVLAMLARKLMDETFVRRLRACTDKAQFYEYLSGELNGYGNLPVHGDRRR